MKLYSPDVKLNQLAADKLVELVEMYRTSLRQ